MNIIVTGASRGIGYELVKLLSAGAGNTVIAIARSAEKLEQLKRDCLSVNDASDVIPVVCDLNDEQAVSALPAMISRYVPVINILINNAGAIVNKPFMDITSADLQKVYTVNVFSTVRLIQQVIPLMDKKQRSHIINISSMGGYQGSAKFAGLSAYSSSKAALACLTECLAEEFKDSAISFNCLALGAAQTEMLEEAFPGYIAPLSALQMATFIADFSLTAHNFMNGKIVPVSMSTP